ncbi:MAG: hypothetical protein EA339_15370 [Rhodobacteraceae bacterium]|nr:MAG: hypothetical protein EA339_15370 [Paracoccaceae bacterium]
MVPDTLAQIPEGEDRGTVTTDAAYDTRRCHTALSDRQATWIIPSRKNARRWKKDWTTAIARNQALRATRHEPRQPLPSATRSTGWRLRLLRVGKPKRRRSATLPKCWWIFTYELAQAT